jgi:inhibitor of KinA
MIQFHAFGDRALLINFEQKIDPGINAAVIALEQAIEAAAIPGITFCIPAYCSLTVGYDPAVLSYQNICTQIRTLMTDNRSKKDLPSSRKLEIPVCYEEPYSLDFPDLTQQTGLSREEIIEFHTSIPFRVYMLGFLPGFAYMGRLPDALFCSRKKTPRLRVPAQSVGLAGFQTGIYPSEAPGGWRIIGRTPWKIFDGGKEDPFLLRPGDEVVFVAITKQDYLEIARGRTSR